jgi:hypothetical protein
MTHYTQDSRIQPALDTEAVDTLLRRESDRDARRWLEHYTDERQRHAGAVEADRRDASAALTDLLPPSESKPIAPLSEPEILQAGAPRNGVSSANEPTLPRDDSDQATAIRSAAAQQQHPIEPPQSLIKALIADAIGGKQFSQDEPARLRATRIGPTKPDAGSSIPTDVMLGQYAQTMPVTPPASLFTSPVTGMDQASDVLSQEAKTGVTFQASWSDVPVNRGLLPQPVQENAATELAMSKALTRDRTLGDHAIGSALSGFPQAVGPGDLRGRAINAPTMIEPNPGSERQVSPWADTPATSSGKESIAAATEELERLRSAARRTADELEKVRGPVPPAFPARPPVFRDRS